MACRLIALYVTVEQELAISDLFYAKGWPYDPEDLPLNVHEEKVTSQTVSEATESGIQHSPTTTVNYYDVQVVQTVTVSESDNETTDYDGEQLLSNLIDTSQAVENDNRGDVKAEMMENRDVFGRSLKNGHRVDTLIIDSVSDSYVGHVSVKSLQSNAEDECADLMPSDQQEKENIFSSNERKHTLENDCYNNADKSTQLDDMQSDSEYNHPKSEFNDDHLDLDEKIQLCTINEFSDLLGDPFENSGVITKKESNNSPRKSILKKHNFDTFLKQDENDLSTVKQRMDAPQIKRRIRQKGTVKDEEIKSNNEDGPLVSEETIETDQDDDSKIENFVDKVSEESIENDIEMKDSLDFEEKETAVEVKVRKSKRLSSARGKEKLKQLYGNRKKLKNAYDNTQKMNLCARMKNKKTEIVPDNDNKHRNIVKGLDIRTFENEIIEELEKTSKKTMKVPSMDEFKRMISVWDAEQGDSQTSQAVTIYRVGLRPVDQPEDLDSHFYSVAYGGWYCSNCRLIFKKKTRLIEHRIETNGKCFHQCDICEKRYSIRSEMLQHRKYHDKDHKPYACHLCDCRYRRQNMLNNHIKQRHLDHNAYMCYQCGKQFKIRPCLLNHLKYAHIQDSDRMALCSQCPKKFKTTHDLKAHMLTHNSDLTWTCDICQKDFKTRKYMREHRKIHSAERDQICDVCGKGFFKLEHLKNHKKLHTGEKPYGCSICSYRCTVKCNLDKHMKTHSNRRIVRTLDSKPNKSRKSVVEYRNVDEFVGLPFKSNDQSTDAEHNSTKLEGNYGHMMEYKNEPYSIPRIHTDSPIHNNITSVLQHDYHHHLNVPSLQGHLS